MCSTVTRATWNSRDTRGFGGRDGGSERAREKERERKKKTSFQDHFCASSSVFLTEFLLAEFQTLLLSSRLFPVRSITPLNLTSSDSESLSGGIKEAELV